MNQETYIILSFVPTIAGLLFMSVIVAARNYKAKINQSFIFWVLSILGYVGVNFIAHYISNLDTALLLTRIALMAANFIPTTFYYFAKCLARKKGPLVAKDWIIYISPFLMAPLTFLPSEITTISQTKYGVILSKTGPLILLTLIYFSYAFYIAFKMLYEYQKTSTQSVRSQIKFITYSSSIVIVVNLVTQIILPKFGVFNLGNIIGNPSILIFVGSVGYSILRHKLFDIRTAILRTIAFLATITLTVVLFIAILLYPFHYLFKDIKLTFWPEVYIVIVTLILAFSYRSLTAYIDKISNRIFYHDHYRPEIVLAQISRVLSSEILLDNLAKKVKKIIQSALNVSQLDIIVLNKGSIFYEADDYFTKIHNELAVDLTTLGDKILITDELNQPDQKSVLEKYGIEVFAPLITHNEKIGYLIFSEKVNGTSFNIDDIRLIDNISNELSVAVSNSRSYSQVQQFNSILQAKIEEATAQLTVANEELKKQDSVKNDFISMISHQLGTPLAVMDGFLTLVVQGFYGKTNDKMMEALEKTLSRTRNMKGLVFDLLNISRMTAGKFFLEYSDVEMSKVVDEEIDELQRQAHERNVKLTYHPPDHNMPIITMDEPKTRQAILNLINNAIYYSPNGSVDVYLDSDQENVIFKVIDTGIGVPDSEKPHLFTKFFRADNARKESPNGTGIGLYLVKRVILDQKGKLIFSSQVGKGSIFGFTLPIKKQEVLKPLSSNENKVESDSGTSSHV